MQDAFAGVSDALYFSKPRGGMGPRADFHGHRQAFWHGEKGHLAQPWGAVTGLHSSADIKRCIQPCRSSSLSTVQRKRAGSSAAIRPQGSPSWNSMAAIRRSSRRSSVRISSMAAGLSCSPVIMCCAAQQRIKSVAQDDKRNRPNTIRTRKSSSHVSTVALLTERFWT